MAVKIRATEKENEGDKYWSVPKEVGSLRAFSLFNDIETEVELISCSEVLPKETIDSSSSEGKVFGRDGFTLCLNPAGIRTSKFHDKLIGGPESFRISFEECNFLKDRS